MADRRFVLTGAASLPCSSSSSPSSQPLGSLFVSGSSSPFLGRRTMFSFTDVKEGNKSGKPLFCSFDQEGYIDDEYEEYMHCHAEKKRRLSVQQVLFLEKSFEEENKLEPERKVQLAGELGLQPRQVAIWFQNRRARWKAKQLEMDYEDLQANYDKLKADYDNLIEEREKLKAEIADLSDKLLHKEKGEENSGFLDTQKPLSFSSEEPTADLSSEGEASQNSALLAPKQEDVTSGKSDDVLDSSYAFHPDQSDISQEDEANLSKGLLQGGRRILVDEIDLAAGYCYFGLTFEENAFSFWP